MTNTKESSRDDNAKLSFYVLLKKRDGLNLSMFDNYWRDVHGPVCARLPGQYQYWQFHLSHNHGGYWQKVDGVEYECSEHDQFDGIAELTFQNEEERNAWFSAASILMEDEHNIFSRAVGYVADNGNAITYKDTLSDGAPNGSATGPRFHMLLQKSDNVSVSDFRKYLSDSYIPALLESSAVSKLRSHFLEEHDNSEDLPPAPGVDHYEPMDKQYQAAIEIAFHNQMEMERFFSSEQYARSIKDQASFVKRVNAFPVRDIYTFVYDGEMTMSGQRGSSTASLIYEIGATNQLLDNISHLMMNGEVQAQNQMTR